MAWNGLDRGETGCSSRGGKGAGYEEWPGFGTIKLTDVRKKGNEKGKPSVRWNSGSREIAMLHCLLVKLRNFFPFAIAEALLLSAVIGDATSPPMHRLPQPVNTEDYLEKKVD